jgi:hypothetical protein
MPIAGGISLDFRQIYHDIIMNRPQNIKNFKPSFNRVYPVK